MNDTSLWLLFSLLVLLLCVSAFFSGTETGLMSINRYRLKHLAKRHRSARRVRRLLKRSGHLFSVILFGNQLANNLAAIVAAAIAVQLYGSGSEFVAALLLTVAMLIFADIAPRTIAKLSPERVVFAASYILKPLLKLLHPLARLINHLSDKLLKVLGFNSDNLRQEMPKKPELRAPVDDARGPATSDHQNRLINSLGLENVTINDIMVPRSEIVGLNLDDDIESLMDQIVSTEHTRLPIFQGDIHHVLGILHMRRVNRLLRRGEGELTKEAIKRFAREPYFVPESTPLHVQLVNFQKNRRRIGLVVDEYGEIQGLVTLEDLLEEIVGELTANVAQASEDITANPDSTFSIDASVNIRDINKTTGWSLPTDGPKTLNGLLLEKLEHIPEGNLCLEFGGYRFETLSLTDKMIDRVRARHLHSVNDGDPDDD